MVFEYEIPQGTKLHFGASARIKRELEHKACEIFYENEFEEIITPSFSYLEHQQNFSNRHIIRLSSQNNHQISLRYDSTIDTIRIITKRLGRSTNHQKWFYIQPVFSYPTSEIYQIGAECLDKKYFNSVINIGLSILDYFHLNTFLQISNVKILQLCINELGLTQDSYNALSIQEITQRASFMKEIIQINDIAGLERFLLISPMFLHFELERLIEKARLCTHNNIIITPLAKPLVDYYDDIVFKLFTNNQILLLGGTYNIQEYSCCGFGIYTDHVVDLILKDFHKR